MCEVRQVRLQRNHLSIVASISFGCLLLAHKTKSNADRMVALDVEMIEAELEIRSGVF